MIATLKKLFSNAAPNEVKTALDEKTTAVAALLIEAALSDETYCDTEKEMVIAVLKRHFSLSETEVEAVINEAEIAHKNADQILYFTRTVKETVEYEDRIHIVEMLWEIVYADGVLSDYEANLLRRICGLIYVDDMESGKARKRVLSRLSIAQ
jgi:uncharacterized tellurite resistance protein B-like protein